MAAMAFRNGDANVVTQDDRDRAKVLCLAVSYGMGSYALAHHLRTTSRSDAEDLKSEFLSKFPGMATFIKRVKTQAKNCGYVTTYITKRRRYLRGISSNNYGKRTHAERQAVNTIIQGTGSDMIKGATIRIREELLCRYKQNIAEIVLQLHDEIVIEINDTSQIETVCKIVKEIMENVVQKQTKVKFPIRLKAGKDLGHLESIESFSVSPRGQC
mmetsp:Transcript_14507/g.17416  ORF Transcript_14507/g.17416 Transcript_14507/m.17416 type:complete len:214 (+) Transcript_14507:70-711(+)